MATTFTFIGADVAVETVTNIKDFDRSKFALVGHVEKPNNGHEATYVRTDTDPLYPVTIRQGFYPKGNGNGEVGLSTRFTLWVQRTVDGVVEAPKPATIVLSSTMPYGAVPDADLMRAALGNILSWVLPIDSATDAQVNSKLLQLRHGIVQDMVAQ